MKGLIFSLIFLGCSVFCFGQIGVADSVYTSVEQMPEFPGGMAALQKYLAQHIRISEGTSDLVQGKMVVRFVIDKNGGARDVTILKSWGEKNDSMMMDIIKNMPVWIPGRKGNEKVNVQYTLPIFVHWGE
jgi:protein TonB